jgi:MFS transporter, DHA1 family, inner membrane transport protein
MASPLTKNSLMLGNFVTGVAVLAPAGMLNELSAGLGVSIQQAGWLVTFGAILLCVGSPLMAWATTRIDRRTLLTGTLLVITLGHIASAIAPNYATLLAARLALLAVAVLYTPQAASAVGLIVSEKERPGAIAYVFIGWSLAVAVGLPVVTLLAASFGWRAAYWAIVVLAAVATALKAIGLPAGLRGAPVSIASWIEIARSRQIVLLLLITVLVLSGTFQVFVYLGPLLATLGGAGPQTIGFTFAAMGAIGLIGNIITTQVVGRFGAFRVSFVLIMSMFLGLVVWAVGTGALAVMLAGSALSSIGFAASNSIQQARLATAAPALSSATIALNTSAIYVGQAIGSAVGGALIARDLAPALGWVATAITGLALIVLLFTRDEGAKVKSP